MANENTKETKQNEPKPAETNGSKKNDTNDNGEKTRVIGVSVKRPAAGSSSIQSTSAGQITKKDPDKTNVLPPLASKTAAGSDQAKNGQSPKKQTSGITNVPTEKDTKKTENKKQEEPPVLISERGKIIFIISLVCLSPIWLSLGAVFFALFAFMYIAVAVLDAALAVGVSLGSIGGIVLSLVGIVYGIICILPGGVENFIGAYELGLGLMIAGIVMVVSVLSYHFIIKVSPMLFRLITKFLVFLIKKITIFIKFIRRECDKI